MNSPPKPQIPTERYMLQELTNITTLYKAILDLSCLMIVKRAKMLIATISTFQNNKDINKGISGLDAL